MTQSIKKKINFFISNLSSTSEYIEVKRKYIGGNIMSEAKGLFGGLGGFGNFGEGSELLFFFLLLVLLFSFGGFGGLGKY